MVAPATPALFTPTMVNRQVVGRCLRSMMIVRPGDQQFTKWIMPRIGDACWIAERTQHVGRVRPITRLRMLSCTLKGKNCPRQWRKYDDIWWKTEQVTIGCLVAMLVPGRSSYRGPEKKKKGREKRGSDRPTWQIGHQLGPLMATAAVIILRTTACFTLSFNGKKSHGTIAFCHGSRRNFR